MDLWHNVQLIQSKNVLLFNLRWRDIRSLLQKRPYRPPHAVEQAEAVPFHQVCLSTRIRIGPFVRTHSADKEQKYADECISRYDEYPHLTREGQEERKQRSDFLSGLFK